MFIVYNKVYKSTATSATSATPNCPSNIVITFDSFFDYKTKKPQNNWKFVELWLSLQQKGANIKEKDYGNNNTTGSR